MTDKKNSDLEEQFPSIDLAYEIAISSFDSVATRLDTMDGRIQTLMAFALSASLAVPTLGRARDLPLTSVWFLCAMLAIGVVIALSIYARLMGTIKILSPEKLWDKWLILPKEEFKKDLISFSITAYKANTTLLEQKWRLSVASMIIFALAVALLVVWVSGHLT